MNTAFFDVNYVSKKDYECLDSNFNDFKVMEAISSELIYGIIPQTEVDISVLIPTFRREVSLKKTLKSVVEQIDPGCSWNVVVIDNDPLEYGEEDIILEIIKQFDCDRIFLFRNKSNIGSGYNWNRGVQLANSKWVCFVHDDDVLMPDALKNIYGIISGYKPINRELGYIHARRKENGRNDNNRPFFFSKKIVELRRIDSLIRYYTDTGSPTCGTTILKKAFISCGGIHNGFGPSADAVLGYKIMKEFIVVISPMTLGIRDWHDNESLKAETKSNMILADYYFAKYRYSLSNKAKIWGKIFGRAQIACDIEEKKKINIDTNSELHVPEAINLGYVSHLYMYFYLVIRKTYTLIRYIKAKGYVK